ncbi:MAG: pseudouridine synthase [Flavobacteriaceae bacterium CG_4_8_14_3_um_filter_34_10]|nr:rRNA pseudouridine synthase [Flavobacteriia bacterium]OIP50903.1 MAG: pseudouridine synthase [Flavobacteriaceae bacterium CG2_30_34_30]PIQ17442.1 MAG: pseudouridine synthase [Flavobacteriaceae bacterium CG18_big_fil_WC_8_21_14_2_50_34_36]PIV48677.1 MAG: pseudouridine synthase [Flavobacteriaceae bacterium CG02_land_8_20_14_3_00_34_13]PIX09075.1 MAG: pseudouridine synthase [Flavobacteriaceae bacterium CG_4_8_14_3_um_filter_34_10]PIZ07548.1 MAG: pseudouridine synthase [Flavobacteriaceae bacter
MAKENDKKSGKREGKSREKSIPFKKSFTNKPPRPFGTKQPKPNSNPDTIRLNKYIANSGMCSRREADLYIATGAVQVNGKVVNEMGYKVKLSDEVKFDGRRINPEEKQYVLLNKPKGFSTTAKEGAEDKSALALVENASKYNLLPVGRLDRNTSGLLLFTNDGDMIKKLTNSSLLIRKIFQVTLDKNLKYEDFLKIQEGINIEGNKIRVDEVSYVENAPKSEIGIQLHSNKNNIVRKIFTHLGYDIIKLDRVVFAGLTKKDLPRGNWKHLTKQELNNLMML